MLYYDVNVHVWITLLHCFSPHLLLPSTWTLSDCPAGKKKVFFLLLLCLWSSASSSQPLDWSVCVCSRYRIRDQSEASLHLYPLHISSPLCLAHHSHHARLSPSPPLSDTLVMVRLLFYWLALNGSCEKDFFFSSLALSLVNICKNTPAFILNHETELWSLRTPRSYSFIGSKKKKRKGRERKKNPIISSIVTTTWILWKLKKFCIIERMSHSTPQNLQRAIITSVKAEFTAGKCTFQNETKSAWLNPTTCEMWAWHWHYTWFSPGLVWFHKVQPVLFLRQHLKSILHPLTLVHLRWSCIWYWSWHGLSPKARGAFLTAFFSFRCKTPQ